MTIFSLIESISDNVYIDFYDYLIRRKSQIQFPIQDKAELEQHYRDYKKAFGSVQMSESFFNSFSDKSKGLLISSLDVKGATPSITNLSKYLYNLRSKFVHEAQLVLNMSGSTTVSRYGKKLVVCKLPIESLMRFFEEGLVAHFS